ncbi:MAG: Rubrerythrin [Armatimonadetes bacterium]|nr:Rubrerythrin [Armatimonadota bacterium]
MAGFADPFYGNAPERKFTKSELIRALRLNVAAEEEATALYEAHADATDNPVAKKVLLDVANEERVHVGEFIRLIDIISAGEEQAWIDNGYEEVDDMAAEVARGDLEPATPAEKRAAEEAEHGSGGDGSSGGGGTTIGSLKA